MLIKIWFLIITYIIDAQTSIFEPTLQLIKIQWAVFVGVHSVEHALQVGPFGLIIRSHNKDQDLRDEGEEEKEEVVGFRRLSLSLEMTWRRRLPFAFSVRFRCKRRFCARLHARIASNLRMLRAPALYLRFRTGTLILPFLWVGIFIYLQVVFVDLHCCCILY